MVLLIITLKVFWIRHALQNLTLYSTRGVLNEIGFYTDVGYFK